MAIRWKISTSIKVTVGDFALVLDVSVILVFQMLDLEN